jgi:hypothetical protein
MTDELNLTQVAILTADNAERSNSNSRARHTRRPTRKPTRCRYDVLDLQAFTPTGPAHTRCRRHKQRPDRRLLHHTAQRRPTKSQLETTTVRDASPTFNPEGICLSKPTKTNRGRND